MICNSCGNDVDLMPRRAMDPDTLYNEYWYECPRCKAKYDTEEVMQMSLEQDSKEETWPLQATLR